MRPVQTDVLAHRRSRWLRFAFEGELGRFRPLILMYGPDGKVEKTPMGEPPPPLVAREIANRLTRIFLRDSSGRRPIYGGTEKFQTDPYWKDHILFYEYFHGDNGAGLGASHQTGWTGAIAKLIEFFGRIDGQQLLEGGKAAAFAKKEPTRDMRVA